MKDVSAIMSGEFDAERANHKALCCHIVQAIDVSIPVSKNVCGAVYLKTFVLIVLFSFLVCTSMI